MCHSVQLPEVYFVTGHVGHDSWWKYVKTSWACFLHFLCSSWMEQGIVQTLHLKSFPVSHLLKLLQFFLFWILLVMNPKQITCRFCLKRPVEQGHNFVSSCRLYNDSTMPEYRKCLASESGCRTIECVTCLLAMGSALIIFAVLNRLHIKADLMKTRHAGVNSYWNTEDMMYSNN